MASPVPDSYGCASGGVIRGGRNNIVGNHFVGMWGQSNAIGRALIADLSASPLNSDAGLLAYINGTFDRVYMRQADNTFAKLTQSNSGCDSGQFGPEFGLAVRWMRETSSGNLFLAKEASSGSSIDPNFVPPDWPYAGKVDRNVAGAAWLANNGFTVTKTGWLWVQGETDYAQTQEWYETRLRNLLTAAESDGMISAATKRLLIQMEPRSMQYGAGVFAAKAAIEASYPAVTKTQLMPYYMKADNLHANGRGQLQMAYNAFEYFFSASHITV